MSELFQTFLEAGEALKLKPELEAKVAEAEAARDMAASEFDFMHNRFVEVSMHNEELRARIAELEAQLNDATFRTTAAEGKLKALVDTVKAVVDLGKESVAEFEPKPEPVNEVVKVPPTPEVPAETSEPGPETYWGLPSYGNPQTPGGVPADSEGPFVPLEGSAGEIIPSPAAPCENVETTEGASTPSNIISWGFNSGDTVYTG